MVVVQTSETTMKTQSTSHSFTSNNGKIVDSLFPQEFLDAIKVLSPHPIFEVPVRNGKMITSCEPKRCYWNSNLIAQTFGGEAIYGYIVDFVDESYAPNTIRLYGHGVWKTPEGKLVDVTPNKDEIYKFRYFLPIDKKLILNGVVTEELRSIVYVGSTLSIPLELGCAVGTNKSALKAVTNIPSSKTSNTPFISDRYEQCFEDSLLYEQFKGKLVWVNAWDGVFVVNLMKEWWENSGRQTFGHDSVKANEYIQKIADAMNPVIEECREGHIPVRIHDGRLKFGTHFFNVHYEAIRTGKKMFDLAGEVDIPLCLLDRNGDSTFGCSMIFESPVCNPSVRDGKTIDQFIPKSLENVVLPKKKSKRKKLMKIAQRYGLTHEEVLVLSDPHLYPHPYIVQNTGIGTTIKSFSRL